MTTPSDNPPLEELDLVIAGMQSDGDEKRVQQVLEKIPGVQAARIIPEGAWIHYAPQQVSKEDIARKLSEAGYSCDFFQDSLSGMTTEVSQE